MKRTRKGFTLVELLIVIAIMGVLAAMMSLSVGSSTATAKAASINNSIHNIKVAALMYQIQGGDTFKESDASEANIATTGKLIDMTKYNKGITIKYKIVAGTEKSGTGEDGDPVVPGKGAYVICKFADDNDKEAIANALRGYEDFRISETDYTVGSFLYHDTNDYDSSVTYDVEMKFPND